MESHATEIGEVKAEIKEVKEEIKEVKNDIKGVDVKILTEENKSNAEGEKGKKSNRKLDRLYAEKAALRDKEKQLNDRLNMLIGMLSHATPASGAHSGSVAPRDGK